MPRSLTLNGRLLYVGIAATLLLSLLTVGTFEAPPARADTGCPTAAGSYAGGNGAGSPWQIATAAQLQRLRDDSATGWDDSFILTADIDMGGCTWTSAIGNGTLGFTGRLDGAGFDVSGLTVSVTATSSNAYAGLVGRLQSPGVVTRIGFSGNVSAGSTSATYPNAYAGGLVGSAESGTTVSYSMAGGSVSASSANNNMAFDAAAGGLVGQAVSATIYDSFAAGASSASVSIGMMPIAYAGGIVGNNSSGVISRTYATGTAAAAGVTSRQGGLAGRSWSGLSDNFHDTTTGMATGVSFGSSVGVAGKTTAQLQQFATYDDSGWDIVNGWQPFDSGSGKVWGICAGSTRAFLLWQYSASPCTSAPGAPTIAAVTPGMTTAEVAYTADDSGGSTITRLEFALDDTATVDDSTTNLASPFTLSGLVAGTQYQVFMRSVNGIGPGPWTAGTTFTTSAPLDPPAPIPASAPSLVTAVASEASAEVSWQAPSSSGSYAVTQYLAKAAPGGRICLTSSTSCVIEGLSNGTTYTVTVQALTGAGWSAVSQPSNAVTPFGPEAKSLVIMGSRGEGSMAGSIYVEGTSTGLAGEAVTMSLGFPGKVATSSTAAITIAPDGTFAWSRRTSKRVRIVAVAGGVRSLAVIIPGR